MKKFTVLALVALSGLAMAKSYNTHGNIHVQHQGKVAAIPANAPVMTRRAAATRQAIRTQNLNFNAQGQARLSGTIRGLGMAAYRFHGQAGQQVRIAPIGKNYAMEFALFDRVNGMNFGRVHRLPTTGEYEVRIVQTRKNAARNRKAYRYDVNVYLGGAAGAVRAPRVASAPRPAAVPALTSLGGGDRRVTSTSEPLVGKRYGAVRALPQASQPVVRREVSSSHIHHSDQPVVSSHRSDKKAGKPVVAGKAAKNEKPQTMSKTYRCQSGGSLSIQYQATDSAGVIKASVKVGKKRVTLTKDNQQTDGKNLIFTRGADLLHLVIKGKGVNSAEVLSFDHGGKTVAFGCK